MGSFHLAKSRLEGCRRDRLQKAVREQKLALERSAAKRERDFYLSRVDKSRAIASIEERLKKKQKVEDPVLGDSPVSSEATHPREGLPRNRLRKFWPGCLAVVSDAVPDQAGTRSTQRLSDMFNTFDPTRFFYS